MSRILNKIRMLLEQSHSGVKVHLVFGEQQVSPLLENRESRGREGKRGWITDGLEGPAVECGLDS